MGSPKTTFPYTAGICVFHALHAYNPELSLLSVFIRSYWLQVYSFRVIGPSFEEAWARVRAASEQS